MAKNTLVGLKELRSSYTVLRRSKPLFRISPVDTEDETGWDTIFDADRDNKGKGIPGGEVLRILRKIKTNERARKTVSKIK